MTVAVFQVVRIIRDVPEQSVAKGMLGAVVAIFDGPQRRYEIEVVDSDGRTIAQATLAEDDIDVLSEVERTFESFVGRIVGRGKARCSPSVRRRRANDQHRVCC